MNFTIFSQTGSWLLLFWQLFKQWILIFISPVYPKLSADMLWTIIAIWINFVVTELYQEKHGTSFGNAIQNGVVGVFVGVDWMRYLLRALHDGSLFANNIFQLKFLTAIAVTVYGVLVVYYGVKARRIVQSIGRIRGVTYVLAVGTPAIYGLVDITLQYLIAVIVFAPLFYGLVEVFSYLVPTPDFN